MGKSSKCCDEMAIYAMEVTIQCASIREGPLIRINTVSDVPDIHANHYTIGEVAKL